MHPARTALDLPLLAAAAVLAASTYFSDDRFLSLMGTYNHYLHGLGPAALCAALYYLAAWSAEERLIRRTLAVCLGAACIVSAYAVVQNWGWEPFPQVGGLMNARSTSTLGSPVSLGTYLALVFPLGLHWALEGRRRILGWLCLAALAGGLIASISRGAWVGAAAGSLAYVVLSGRSARLTWDRKRLGALALGLMVAAGIMAWRLSARGPHDSARGEVWKIALNVFQEKPWLGTGPDTFELGFRRLKTRAHVQQALTSMEYQTHAHNDFLQALATTGALGCAAYVFLLVALVRAAMRALADPARKPWAAALCSGLLALFVIMKVNPVPLEAVSLAALFTGFLCRPAGGLGTDSPRPAKLTAWVLVLAAGGMAAFAVRLAAADREIKTAQIFQTAGRPGRALSHFQAGLELNRHEMIYHVDFVNFLNAQAATVRNGFVQKELLEKAVSSGREAVEAHPRLSLSHYTLGVAALMQARLGMPERLAVAEEELDAALRLDPLLDTLLRTRLDAALMRGDIAKTAELRQRLRELRYLSNRRPPS